MIFPDCALAGPTMRLDIQANRETEGTSEETESESVDTESRIESSVEPEEASESEEERSETSSEQDEQSSEVSFPEADGSLVGETLNFVDLYWQNQHVLQVTAIFAGGDEADASCPMTEADRGKFTVTIPEGAYSTVTFRIKTSDAEEIQQTAHYNIYNMNISGEENTVSIAFAGGYRDTFYYDGEQYDSYWGADALYEMNTDAVSTYSMDSDEAEQGNDAVSAEQSNDAVSDLAGNTLYFVDMQASENLTVKRVTMQFFKEGHTDSVPAVSSVMYEGREHIFSAPIPEGGYEEATFYIEFADYNGQAIAPHQMTSHFNLYTGRLTTLVDGSAQEDATVSSFIYKAGSMDTLFYSNPTGDSSAIAAQYCFVSRHPGVANNSLDGEMLYVDVSDRNGNGITLDPDTMKVDYGDGEKDFLGQTREENIYYFQFPKACGAAEQTVITLRGMTKVDASKAPDAKPREVIFKFYYPYGSDRLMLLADNIETYADKFVKFEFKQDTKQLYVCYDNSRTKFTNIQYRITDGSGFRGNWTNLQKASADSLPNVSETLRDNLWGTTISDYDASKTYYIQFRGTTDNRRYTSSTDSTASGSLAEIPASKYSYPCFYGVISSNNLTGKWKPALGVVNMGDGSVEIPEGTFTSERDTYYGTSTFYDYYSDYELNGGKLKDKNYYDGNEAGTIFNEAISDYYQERDTNGQDNPLYLNQQSQNSSLYRWNQKNNKWSGSDKVAQGAVGKSLQNGKLVSSGSSTEVSLFNESFLRGNNSLGIGLGAVYNNVKFPFKKNAKGYWEFDSSQPSQTLRMQKDVHKGYYLQRTGENIWANGVANPGTSFFPFNGFGTDGTQRANQDNNKLDYLFGTHLDIPFTLPDGGKVSMETSSGSYVEQDVTFEFSGDDDCWIYVDGKLVLDMGGIHDAVTGTINFASKTWVIQQSSGNLTGSFELDDSIEEHTLSMFYMERGLGASNLKLTFNFPKTNTLNVTNQIDTSAADSFFQEVLSYIGSFTYRISNKVTSGQALAVENSAGYISSSGGKTFNAINNAAAIDRSPADSDVSASVESGHLGTYLKLSQTTALSSSASDKEVIQRLTSIKPQSGSSMDISDEAYMQMMVYNDRKSEDTNGALLYIALRDVNGNRIGGWANTLAYSGSSNAAGSKNWSEMQIDVNKMRYMDGTSTFDRTKVAAVEVAYRYADTQDNPSGVYIDDITFHGTVTEVPKRGFAVEDAQISDYGSVQSDGSYSLSPANGAWYGYYTSGVSEAKQRVVTNGSIGLGDGQRAEFLDKFRIGAYIQITQKDVNPNVFDTTWSIREGTDREVIPENALLASREDMATVKNTGERTSLEDVKALNTSGEIASSVTANDGRIAMDASGNAVDRPIVSETGNIGSLVYRSYLNPDNDANNPIDLTVAYVNRLKTGSITIHKKVTLNEGQSAEGAVYRFQISFSNIAGMDLEDKPLTKILEVTIGKDGTGSATFDGIPAGTEYEIRELKNDGVQLQSIEDGGSTVKDGGKAHDYEIHTGTSDTAPYVTGTVYASDQAYVFNNTIEPFVMTIEKHWDDAGNEANRPSAIGIRLYRKAAGDPDDAYENVTKDFYGNSVGQDAEGDYIKLSAANQSGDDSSIWTAQTKELDTVNNEGRLYTYKIEEIKLDEAEGWSLDNYEAEYIQGDENGHYIVTNRPTGITVQKVWEDKEDAARPTALRIQLQRRIKDTGTFVNVGDPQILSVNDKTPWKYENRFVERVDAKGQIYEYRVIETAMIDAKGHETSITDNAQTTNGYKIAYTSNEDNTLLTITNSKGTGQVLLKKTDSRNDEIGLSGAVFKVERLKPRNNKSEEHTDFTVGAYNKDQWMADENYGSTEITTGPDGQVDLGYLPYGYYRLTEVTAPEGYYKLENPYDFKVTEAEAGTSDTALTVIIKDDKMPYFSFKKTDKSGDPLAGAKFGLYKLKCTDTSHQHDQQLLTIDADGQLSESDQTCWEMAALKTSVEGTGLVDFTGLDPTAEYRLVEYQAPAGYVLPAGQWKITADQKGEFAITAAGDIANTPAFKKISDAQASYSVMNYAPNELPFSGNKGIYGFLAAGAVLMAGGALWLLIRRRRYS